MSHTFAEQQAAELASRRAWLVSTVNAGQTATASARIAGIERAQFYRMCARFGVGTHAEIVRSDAKVAKLFKAQARRRTAPHAAQSSMKRTGGAKIGPHGETQA